MGSIDTTQLSSLIGRVYQASAEPELWPDTLRGVADALGAKSAVLRTLHVGEHRAVETTYHLNMHDELQHAYRRHFVQADPYLEALQRVPAGRMVSNDNLVDLDRLRRTEFYHQYLQPLDNHFIIGGFLERGEQAPGETLNDSREPLADQRSPCSLVGFHRHSGAQPFSAGLLNALQEMAPHLRRALWLRRLMEQHARRATAAEAALDGLPLACFLVGGSGRLTHANHRGEALLRDDPRLTLHGGRLLATSAPKDKMFRPLFDGAAGASDPGPSAQRRTVLLKSHRGDAPNLVAVIAPIPERFRRLCGAGGGAAVYVGNLDDTGVLSAALLRELYNLTPAEARVAESLGRGRSLSALGTEWSVSPETLRSHLKRVLSKTGTSRQAELVRLLCGRPWTLAEDDPSPQEATATAHGPAGREEPSEKG